MTREVLYMYLGTNGTIVSPVHLEDTYYVRKIVLRAEPGYKLTKDDANFYSKVNTNDGEEKLWREVRTN